MKRFLLLSLMVVLVGGCVPWERTGGAYSDPDQNVSLELPDGWMRWNSKEYLLLTRDGVLLQNILVERIHVEDALTHTKKKFRRGMLPQELAEVIIDNTRSNQEVLDLKVQENNPATVGSHPGFRAVYTYRSADGLKYRSLYYGFMEGEWFYGIRYDAPQRHYYDRDLKTFENVVKSLRLANEA